MTARRFMSPSIRVTSISIRVTSILAARGLPVIGRRADPRCGQLRSVRRPEVGFREQGRERADQVGGNCGKSTDEQHLEPAPKWAEPRHEGACGPNREKSCCCQED